MYRRYNTHIHAQGTTFPTSAPNQSFYRKWRLNLKIDERNEKQVGWGGDPTRPRVRDFSSASQLRE